MKSGEFAAREDKQAILCFVDYEGKGDLPMVPVRKAVIESHKLHGSSISLLLVLKEFVFAPTKAFTDEISQLSSHNNPKNTDGTRTGKYVLPLTSAPTCISSGRSLDTWESTVTELAKQDTFKIEPFFWTILKCSSTPNDSESMQTFEEWPGSFAGGTDFRMFLYHFHPTKEPDKQHRLNLTVSGPLEIDSHETLIVDSKYDLKDWKLRSKSALHKKTTAALRIEMNDTYNVDLLVDVEASVRRPVLWAVIMGLLVAAPSILSMFHEKEVSPYWPAILLLSLLFGVLAGLAVVFKIERVEGIE